MKKLLLASAVVLSTVVAAQAEGYYSGGVAERKAAAQRQPEACFDIVREGYLVVNISEPEYDRATVAVKAIEKLALQAVPNLNTDTCGSRESNACIATRTRGTTTTRASSS